MGYMEAYGSVGSYADSIIKRSIEGAIGRKIAKEDAKEAFSNEGVSPTQPSEGGSQQATPQASAENQPTVESLTAELQASEKAQKSLQNKLKNMKAQRDYEKSLRGMYQKELLKTKKAELVGGGK